MEVTSPRHLKIANWSVMAVLVVAGLAYGFAAFSAVYVLGGLAAVTKLHPLHQTLRGTFGQRANNPREGAGQAKAWFAFRQLLRFFVLLAIIFLLVGQGWVNIFGLLLGLSTVVLTLMLAALYETIKLKNKEANPSHGTPHSIS